MCRPGTTARKSRPNVCFVPWCWDWSSDHAFHSAHRSSTGRGYPRTPRSPRPSPTPCASPARCTPGATRPSPLTGRRRRGARRSSGRPTRGRRRSRRTVRAASPRGPDGPGRAVAHSRAGPGWGGASRKRYTACRTGGGRAGVRCRRCGSRGGPPACRLRGLRCLAVCGAGDARMHARRHRDERAWRGRWSLFACGATPTGAAVALDPGSGRAMACATISHTAAAASSRARRPTCPSARASEGPQPSAGGMLALKRSRLAGSSRRLSCRSRSQVADGKAAATRAAV